MNGKNNRNPPAPDLLPGGKMSYVFQATDGPEEDVESRRLNQKNGREERKGNINCGYNCATSS